MKYKILVVDDEEPILLVVKEALIKNYDVLTASEGRAAIEIIKNEKPSFVFLDIKMPGMSGLEVLELLKDTGAAPIVWMLTGDEDLEVAVSTLKGGARGYITKPFDIEVIRNVVLTAVEDLERRINPGDSGEKPWRVKKKK